ncbi:MAG: hypothetical protein E5Y55_24205 [Mesorhizobium sp.]|uniref:hypothetical protein n=1 Tax=Mesorhizobium sp. TaxID=1871066 RepID=UPI00121AAE6C|nr:hypothetical protein [Mesorhizobium sp.]TIM41785.1 MAG: hypothetical protein E5Y55_24205 [Mesorhizobium sp.]
MKWTAENKAEAARLWATGMNGAEVAAVVGVEPKELYGLARRNPSLFRPRGHGRTRVRKTAAPPQVTGPALPLKPKFPPKAPGHDGVPHGRLTSCQCEFPLWGHHEEFDVASSLFCGAPWNQESRRPYCTFHAIATAGTGTPVERRAVRDAVAVNAREAVAA